MLTLSCDLILFCTAVPMHQAAILRISASSFPSSATSGVQRARLSRLLALSTTSINCSKLSKATSLSDKVMSGDWIAAMDCCISSASDGPPMSDFIASALRPRPDDRSGSVEAVESSRVVSEFSMLHFRSWFIPGSIIFRRREKCRRQK